MTTNEAIIQLLGYGKSVYNRDTHKLYVYKFSEDKRNGIVNIYMKANGSFEFVNTFEELDYLELFHLYTDECDWEILELGDNDRIKCKND